MPRKKTTDQFIEEANIVHNNKYDYSVVKYEGNNKKITIICKEHGQFIQSPQKHLIGQGCKICKGYVDLNHDSFIERANNIHNNKYDYSKIIVKSKHEKVIINCNIHGEFKQLPHNHLKGQGCPVCGKIERTNSQRFTSKEFIDSVILTHKNKYNYSKVNYINSQTKIEIICPFHGVYSMKPNSHYNGQGCPKCGRISAKKNITLEYQVFLERAEKIHQNKYTYQEDSYINYTSKMNIFCSEHGYFNQTPHSHISMKSGCPKCGIIKTQHINQKNWVIVQDLFLVTHGTKYEYDQNSFVDVTTKMKIKCPSHGWFIQKPHVHYSGSGCKKCAREELGEKLKINFTEFVNRAKLKHGEIYKYNKLGYIDIFTPFEIECTKHGVFSQKPRDHYRGSGCPKCISSRGETQVRLFLESKNIRYEVQKTFNDLNHKNKLRCDFYLPDHNIVIEYNGVQHYEPISVFGGITGLIQTQKRDTIKYDYLKKNKITLIIVRYDINDINKYLTRLFNN